jgi:hypothetical protein
VGRGRARAGAVRALGKRYAKVGSANLAQLAIFAVELGFAGSRQADG